MRKGRGDFFDVVGDENDAGAAPAAGKRFDGGEETLPREGIEAGARFVKNEEARAGDEGAGDEHALALALREMGPRARGEVGDIEGGQESAGEVLIVAGGPTPKIEHRIAAADHGFEGELAGRDGGSEGGGDDAEFAAHLTPIGGAEGATEEPYRAAAGREKTGEHTEERGLTATIGPHDDPVLAACDAPIDAVEDDGVAARDAELVEVKEVRRDGGRAGGHIQRMEANGGLSKEPAPAPWMVAHERGRCGRAQGSFWRRLRPRRQRRSGRAEARIVRGRAGRNPRRGSRGFHTANA